MRITNEELTAAFTLWDKEYREKPREFMNEVEHLLDNTPDEFGEQCTVCLEAYVKRIRKDKKD